MSDKGIRNQRKGQILGRGNYVSSGGVKIGLIESARMVLLQARKTPQLSIGDNFLTLYGPSAIVLAVTAFECSLNEVLHTCLRTATASQRAEYEKLAEEDNLIKKFKMIPAFATGRTPLENPDLEVAQQVRHEIVHYYPRHIGTPTGVPEWFRPLVDKNLLLEISDPSGGDICWDGKLLSFKLAQWCGRVVASAAGQFESALTPVGEEMTMPSVQAMGMSSAFHKLVI